MGMATETRTGHGHGQVEGYGSWEGKRGHGSAAGPLPAGWIRSRDRARHTQTQPSIRNGYGSTHGDRSAVYRTTGSDSVSTAELEREQPASNLAIGATLTPLPRSSTRATSSLRAWT